MLDILCVGDSKIDIFLRIPENNPHIGLEEEKKKLLISYGEKIFVDKYILGIGGNATNTAVGISRLGFNVGLCAEIGKDEFSQKILDELKKENINTDLLIQNDEESTSISVVVSYRGDRTIFSEHVQRDHNFNLGGAETKFVYITSLGSAWEPPYEKALEFVKTKNLKLAFNPGSLQLEKRGKIMTDILERTDYLFVNKEEAEEILYGEELNLPSNNNSHIKKLLFGLKSLGIRNAIITDSDNGSFLQDENDKIYHLGIVKVEVEEKTGAGDAYTAGFLSAILNGKESKDAMVWGAIDSSSVIEKIGSEEGLLTKQQLEEKNKSLEGFSPEEM